MKKSVYIETSIVSYLVSRPSRDILTAAHQKLTKRWWETRRVRFSLFASQLVLDEAAGGDPDAAKKRLKTIEGIPLLMPTDETIRLAELLIRKHALPPKAADDALHVALAATGAIDYLLTWNCKHIANAENLWLIQETVRQRGFAGPTICTPEEFLGGDHEE